MVDARRIYDVDVWCIYIVYVWRIRLASTDGEVYNAVLACLKDDKDKKFFSLEMREKYNVIT